MGTSTGDLGILFLGSISWIGIGVPSPSLLFAAFVIAMGAMNRIELRNNTSFFFIMIIVLDVANIPPSYV